MGVGTSWCGGQEVSPGRLPLSRATVWALSLLWEFALAPEPAPQSGRVVPTAEVHHLPVLEAGRLRSRCLQGWFLLGLHPWCVDGCLLPVSSHGHPLGVSVSRSPPAILDQGLPY